MSQLARSILRSSLQRGFVVKLPVGDRKAWYDTTFEKKEQKNRYLRPEEVKEYKKQQVEAYYAEDYKGKLLEARPIQADPIIENDYVFGTELPQMLDVDKTSPLELYGTPKLHNYHLLMQMYSRLSQKELLQRQTRRAADTDEPSVREAAARRGRPHQPQVRRREQHSSVRR